MFKGSKYNKMLIELSLTSREMKFFFFSVFAKFSAASFAAFATLFFMSPYASNAAYVFFSLILIFAKFVAILTKLGSNSSKIYSVLSIISVSKCFLSNGLPTTLSFTYCSIFLEQPYWGIFCKMFVTFVNYGWSNCLL